MILCCKLHHPGPESPVNLQIITCLARVLISKQVLENLSFIVAGTNMRLDMTVIHCEQNSESLITASY